MPNFDDIAKAVLTSVGDAAKKEGSNFVAGAKEDGQAFLDSTKADLQRWTAALALGQLSKEDFAVLVRGKKSLAEMKALTDAGLAAAGVDRIQTALINAVIREGLKAIA